jgi:hypothetical protein
MHNRCKNPWSIKDQHIGLLDLGIKLKKSRLNVSHLYFLSVGASSGWNQTLDLGMM